MTVRKTILSLVFVWALVLLDSCGILDPEPIDLLVNEVVLNEAKDIPNVEVGLYSAFRGITANVVIAGDLTADMLLHIGTFSQYRELGIKKITSANASVAGLWGSIYSTVYIANFMIEKIPEIPAVTTVQRDQALATAHFIRGMAYFIGVNTFGGIPKVTSTDIDVNRNISRTAKEEILAFILEDFQQALGNLPENPVSPAFAGGNAVRSALARYYLYQKDWVQAEAYASDVIASDSYQLESKFETVVNTDFPDESIFEVGYTIADDPATLNTLFKGRFEMIPSNEEVIALASTESGDRFSSIEFSVDRLKGANNGWAVSKYGTAVEDNNNIMVFRLAEIYLIRAEARAQQGKTTGTGSAQEDINILRVRANAPPVGAVSQSQMIRLIEEERRYELAYEGHRWYDLVRTGRVEQVMPVFNSNWISAYELWPIPQRELQNNPGLAGSQNPGY